MTPQGFRRKQQRGKTPKLPNDSRWWPSELEADSKVHSILSQASGYVCDEIDRRLGLISAHTPETDMLVATIEDLRGICANLRQISVELAQECCARGGLNILFRLDTTHENTYTRRFQYEARCRQRADSLPESHRFHSSKWL